MSARAYAAISRSRSRNARASSADARASILISGSDGAAVIGPPLRWTKRASAGRHVDTKCTARSPRTRSVSERAGLVGDQRRDLVARELVAAFESGELDEEREAD